VGEPSAEVLVPADTHTQKSSDMEPLVIVPLDRDGNEVISTTATMPEGEGLRRSNRLRQLPATNAKVLATEHFSEGLPQECVRRLADPTDALAQMVWSDG
jgi:hypothetical protein